VHVKKFIHTSSFLHLTGKNEYVTFCKTFINECICGIANVSDRQSLAAVLYDHYNMVYCTYTILNIIYYRSVSVNTKRILYKKICVSPHPRDLHTPNKMIDPLSSWGTCSLLILRLLLYGPIWNVDRLVATLSARVFRYNKHIIIIIIIITMKWQIGTKNRTVVTWHADGYRVWRNRVKLL